MNLEYCFTVLEMSVVYDLDLVNKRYHELVKKYHPDLHDEKGSEEKIIELNLAYQEIKKYISKTIMDEKRGVSGNNDFDYDDSYENNSVQDIKIVSIIEEIMSDLKVLYQSMNVDIKRYKRMLSKIKSEYQCFVEFKDFLKEETYINKLVKNINVPEKELRKRYNIYCRYAEETKQIPYSFIEWLEFKLREKKAIEDLNSTYKKCSQCYEEYRNSIICSSERILSFAEWLESKVKEQHMLKTLNMTYDLACNEYNYYCFEAMSKGYSIKTFSSWLETLYNNTQIKTYKKKV